MLHCSKKIRENTIRPECTQLSSDLSHRIIPKKKKQFSTIFNKKKMYKTTSTTKKNTNYFVNISPREEQIFL